MKTLNLSLSKKWFDMIHSGEKREEYREIKNYWCRRLLHSTDEIEWAAWDEMITDMRTPTRHNGYAELMKYFAVAFRSFDVAQFVNGYGAHRPSFVAEITGISLGHGRTEWGAEPGVNYLRIGIGRLSTKEGGADD